MNRALSEEKAKERIKYRLLFESSGKINESHVSNLCI